MVTLQYNKSGFSWDSDPQNADQVKEAVETFFNSQKTLTKDLKTDFERFVRDFKDENSQRELLKIMNDRIMKRARVTKDGVLFETHEISATDLSNLINQTTEDLQNNPSDVILEKNKELLELALAKYNSQTRQAASAPSTGSNVAPASAPPPAFASPQPNEEMEDYLKRIFEDEKKSRQAKDVAGRVKAWAAARMAAFDQFPKSKPAEPEKPRSSTRHIAATIA